MTPTPDERAADAIEHDEFSDVTERNRAACAQAIREAVLADREERLRRLGVRKCEKCGRPAKVVTVCSGCEQPVMYCRCRPYESDPTGRSP